MLGQEEEKRMTGKPFSHTVSVTAAKASAYLVPHGHKVFIDALIVENHSGGPIDVTLTDEGNDVDGAAFVRSLPAIHAPNNESKTYSEIGPLTLLNDLQAQGSGAGPVSMTITGRLV